MGSSNGKNQEQLLPTKFVPPYAWIFMDEVDTELLQKSGKTNYLLAPWYWQYIFRTVLLSFCMNFHPNLNFTYETFYCNVNCLDLNINLKSTHNAQKLNFFMKGSAPVNVTKSTISCGFGHIYWENPSWKTSFFMQWDCHQALLSVCSLSTR